MMETILFSFILLLIIIWMMLGILYFYMRYVSPYDFIIKNNGQGHKNSKNDVEKNKHKKNEQTDFVLIGKSRSTSPIIPQVPPASSSENSEQNSNNFAREISGETNSPNEEDNEFEVNYEMERVDEDEVILEDLNIPIDSSSEDAEVSHQSILARDLGRIRTWSKNTEEVDDGEVKETIGFLKGTDLIEKYKEHIAKMQGEQSTLLEKIRRAEEEEHESSTENSSKIVPENAETAIDDMDDKPLSYYL